MLELLLLGSPQIRYQGRVLEFPLRKNLALVSYLALEGSQSREKLAGLLWPESSEERARSALRKALVHLREALPKGGKGLLEAERETLYLSKGLYQADVYAFESISKGNGVTDLTKLSQAAGLYRGPLLEGLSLPDAPDFEDWLSQRRFELSGRYKNLLERLSGHYLEQDRFPEALEVALRWLKEDDLDEAAYRQVMRVCYLMGDRSTELATFARCKEVLIRELGVEPEPQTLELLRDLERSTALPTVRPHAKPKIPLAVLRPPVLAGREVEWAMLEEAWVQEQIILIAGDPGVGKSRLLQDFVTSKGTALRLEGRPGDAGLPFVALLRLLRQALPYLEAQTLEPWVLRELSRLLPELGESPGPITAEWEKLRLFEACAIAVEQAAKAGDFALLAVDDLQFVDRSSFEVLRFLVTRNLNNPEVRIVVAYRTHELSPEASQDLEGWLEAEQATRIALQPLSPEAVGALLDGLEVAGLARLGSALTRYTGGNPLFVVETLKALYESAELEDALKQSVLPQTMAVSGKVGILIGKRLERLSPEALRLAQVAAITGTEFSLEVAAEILEIDQLMLSRPWGELEAAQILRDGRFTHDLVYENTKNRISQSLRKYLHGRALAILESRGSNASILVWHANESEEFQKVAHYSLLAGEWAYTSGALLEAEAFFSRAIELLPETDLEGRWRAVFRRVQVRYVLGGAKPWWADIDTMLEIAQSSGNTRFIALAWVYKMNYHIYMWDRQPPIDYRVRLGQLEEGLKAARQGGHLDLAATLLYLKALSLQRLGEAVAAKQAAEAALTCIENLGEERETEMNNIITSLDLSLMFFPVSGQFGRAVELTKKACAAALRCGDRSWEVHSQNQLAGFQIQAGLFEMALATLEPALKQATSLGFARNQSRSLLHLGMVRFFQGQLTQAKDLETQAHNAFVAYGFDPWGEAWTLQRLGYISEQQKDFVEARRYYQEARQLFVVVDTKQMAIEGVAGLARSALAQNQLESAGQLAGEVWNYLGEHGGWGADRPALLYLSCADIFEATGSASTAREAIEKGYCELIERSYQLSDLEWRTSLLENIPENRELLLRWREIQVTGS